MRKFRVLLKGRNFLLNSEGAVRRFGFYTTRFVDAQDRDEAEQRAVELLRQDKRLQEELLNDPSDPPMIFADEIDEVSSVEVIDDPLPGFAFFEDQMGEE